MLSVEIPIASVLFLTVLAGSLVSYLRHPSAVAGAVVLVFAASALVFVGVLLDAFFDASLPEPLATLSIVGLLAQPLLTLRLAAMLERVPRWGMVVAAVAFLATALPVVLLPRPWPAALILAAGGVYAGTGLAAATYFIIAARRRIGAARVRLLIAGGATVVLAGALLLTGAGAAVADGSTWLPVASRYAVLGAAIGYVVAFLAPGWLRRVMQATTAYGLSRRLLAGSAAADAAATWRRFVELVANATGVADGAVIVGSSEGEGYAAASVGSLDLDGRSWDAPTFAALMREAKVIHQRRVHELSDELRELVEGSEARYLTLVPLDGVGDEVCLLVLAGRHRSLFARDERDMLRVLGVEAALLADRAARAAEQAALADRLQGTVEALRGANQAKSDFLASMSHELRTPLNAILGFSDLMRGEPEADGRHGVPAEWIEHVHVAGQHLLSLINDVLDLAKVEAGRLELRLEPMDPAAAVSEALAGLRPLADQKGIQISSDVALPVLRVDRGRLRQILYNLLSNAIKYTPEGGEVRVEGGADAAEVRIAVVDSGVGIAPEDHEAVFEEFTQVGEPEARQAGTGLGLALTRRLVEAHGGRLELESSPGAGSRFTVVLPCDAMIDGSSPAAPPEHAGLIEAAPDAPASAGAVLVIEDDPSAVSLLRRYLEPAGYHMIAAANGVDGLAAARQHRPSAILLDVLLPQMDGWDVLRRLKADPELHDIPVLMITVVDEQELGLALGAVDYLVKPIQRVALLDALRRHVPGLMTQSRPRVLAVDDEPAARAFVQATLESAGCEVVVASDGREAIDAAADGEFDLVICDLVMPEVDGFAVVSHLKAAAATRDTPILILTAQTLDEADKARLNGKIVGICEKGADAPERLRHWLARVAAASPRGASG